MSATAEKKVTRVGAIREAIRSGLTSLGDIQSYCEGRGIRDVKRSYISCVKWHVARETSMDDEKDILEFILESGGIHNALKKLHKFSEDRMSRLVARYRGVEKAEREVSRIGKLITA